MGSFEDYQHARLISRELILICDRAVEVHDISACRADIFSIEGLAVFQVGQDRDQLGNMNGLNQIAVVYAVIT